MERLKAEGVQCFLTNENVTNVMTHMTVGLGGVSLMMDQGDFERAREILGEE